MALPPGPRTPGLLVLLDWMRAPIRNFDESFATWGDLYSVKNPLYGVEVVISHPALVRQIFTGDPDVYLAGEANQMVAPVVGQRSILLLDRRPHHRERKLLMPPFHGERLAIYADTMRARAERMVDELPLGEEIALLPAMQRLTFDVILETVFGAREGEDAAIERLRARLLALLERLQSPLGLLWMLPAMQRDLGPLTGWAKTKRTLAEADESIHGIIARAREAGAEGRAGTDVLSLLLAARDEDGAPMSDQELRDELITLLIAGHETTAVALCWAVDEIARRPAVVARITQEIQSIASDDLQRAELPYLDATIKEVLRLHPLTPLLVRKTGAPITLREHAIPAGTILVICVHNVHRHPDFWDDPDEFRPERFLDHKPDPYAFLPFGGGARRCIGMAFALFEMRVVLATLLGRARLRLPRGPAKVTLRSFLFAPEAGARAIVESRGPRASASAA